MTKLTENVKYLENALENFEPVTLKYGKDTVIGFPNNNGGSDLIIFLKPDEMVMSFGFQNAHFAGDDAFSCAEHTKKYLTSEYASVEFFMGDKDLFGGSRLSSTINFDSVEGIVNCYALGNETAREGLYKFFKENKGVTVHAVTYDNKINKVVSVEWNGNDYIINELR